MAIRFSTGLRHMLYKHMSLKEVFHDGVIRIYTGTQPVSADNAVPVNSTLLVSLTKDGENFVAGERSIQQITELTIVSQAAGIYTVTIGNDNHSYVSGGGESSIAIASKLSLIIDYESDVVSAIAVPGAPKILLRARFGGVAFTVTTDINRITKDDRVANYRAAGIQWGSIVNNMLHKESGDWKGIVAAGGLAGWFRIYGNAMDAGGVSTTLPRIDGSVSSTSGDMILRSTQLSVSEPVIVHQATINIPT